MLIFREFFKTHSDQKQNIHQTAPNFLGGWGASIKNFFTRITP